jgi:hypothetical protein
MVAAILVLTSQVPGFIYFEKDMGKVTASYLKSQKY